MATALTAGNLTDRVTIQQKSTTADGQGGRSTTWGTLATVWAQVMPLRMGEKLQAAAVGSTLGYRVTVRYRADITPAMRIRWTPFKAASAKTLEIHGVQPFDGGRRLLTLDCAEVI
jgi:SPP1 family predicted phage head-tail adaptor